MEGSVLKDERRTLNMERPILNEKHTMLNNVLKDTRLSF